MKLALAAGLVSVALALATADAQSSAHFAAPENDHARVNPLAGRPEVAQAGGRIYRDHCAQCHQADAQGDGKKKPSLRTAEVRGASDGDLDWFLRQGDLRHGMPSWSSLTQGQRWAIIEYLRSLK